MILTFFELLLRPIRLIGPFFFSVNKQIKKTALVTGANKGIGKEVVRQLASLGYQVYLGSRDEARGQKVVDEFRALKLDVHLLVIDVASDDSVIRAAEVLSSKISALDVLVNNAGMTGPAFDKAAMAYIPILQEKLEDIKATFEVNVFGVIRVTNAFVELLKKSKSPRIVNVGSGIGSLAINTDTSSPWYEMHTLAYIPSKTALNAITIVYAKGLKPFNIKVNVSHPGLTATDATGGVGHSLEIGAQATVHLATLPDDGPTGSFHSNEGTVPW